MLKRNSALARITKPNVTCAGTQRLYTTSGSRQFSDATWLLFWKRSKMRPGDRILCTYRKPAGDISCLKPFQEKEFEA